MRHSTALPKLVALALLGAAAAATLLAIRQRRVEAAHEIARIQAEIAQADQTLWKLRIEIANRIHPAQVQVKAASLGELAPIYGPECEPEPPAPERRADHAAAPAPVRRSAG